MPCRSTTGSPEPCSSQRMAMPSTTTEFDPFDAHAMTIDHVIKRIHVDLSVPPAVPAGW